MCLFDAGICCFTQAYVGICRKASKSRCLVPHFQKTTRATLVDTDIPWMPPPLWGSSYSHNSSPNRSKGKISNRHFLGNLTSACAPVRSRSSMPPCPPQKEDHLAAHRNRLAIHLQAFRKFPLIPFVIYYLVVANSARTPVPRAKVDFSQ